MPGLDELWDGMDHSALRALRKSLREGVEVRVQDSRRRFLSTVERHAPPFDLSHRPNGLLVWEGIGKEAGFDFLDFGLSDINQECLVRYKRKFSTEEKIISFPSLRAKCLAKFGRAAHPQPADATHPPIHRPNGARPGHRKGRRGSDLNKGRVYF